MALLRCQRFAAAAAIALLLDRRTFHGPIGTEYAAVTGQGFQENVTTLALVEVDTRIGWHDFNGGYPALRTGKGGFQNCLSLHALLPHYSDGRPQNHEPERPRRDYIKDESQGNEIEGAVHCAVHGPKQEE